jgi:hypothetical protein
MAVLGFPDALVYFSAKDRNHARSDLLTAVVVSLSAGLVASTWQMRRARVAEGDQRNLRLDTEARAYGLDMLAAGQAVAANNFGRARMLLDRSATSFLNA